MVLSALINHPERLNRDTLYELRNIVARYPYFQVARLLMLNNMYLLHEPDFGVELRRSVLYIADRRALCRLIEGYTDRIDPEVNVVADNPGIDRTLSLIDAFLSTLPEEYSSSALPVEDMGDYASRFLVDQQPEEHSNNENEQSLIDDFLNTFSPESENVPHEPTLPVAPTNTIVPESKAVSDAEIQNDDADEELLDEGYFTETLAKIYIKQRKYSRALEIIRSLYLKYPEKNIYFADQIRFLEKLIINNNSK